MSKEKHHSTHPFHKVFMTRANQKVSFRCSIDWDYALVMTTLSELI